MKLAYINEAAMRLVFVLTVLAACFVLLATKTRKAVYTIISMALVVLIIIISIVMAILCTCLQ